MAFTGLRGVGKTVLLDHLVDRAIERGWAGLRLQASSHEGNDSLTQLTAVGDTLMNMLATGSATGKALRRGASAIDGISVSLAGAGASLKFGKDGTRAELGIPMEFDALLTALGETARDRGVGVFIAIDELQGCSRSELLTFGRTMQAANSRHLPILYAFAGLPSTREHMVKIDSVTFTERVEWSRLQYLTPTETATAIEEPLIGSGRRIDAGALEMLVELTHGYPFLVQAASKRTVDAAGASDLVTKKHVMAALPGLTEDLAEGVYGASWSRTAPQERRFLYAMSVATFDLKSDEVASSEVYRRLGLTGKQASMYRARLIERGLIDGSGRRLAFTLPGFGSFVLQHRAVMEPEITVGIEPPAARRASVEFSPGPATSNKSIPGLEL